MTSVAPLDQTPFSPPVSTPSSSSPVQNRQTPARRTTLTSPTASAAQGSSGTAHSHDGQVRQRSDEYDDEDDGEDEDDEEYYEGGAASQNDGTGLGQEASEMLKEVTVKAGYLWKKGEKRKNWKKRWFVLRSSKLCYYKNEKEYQLLRYIDMSEVHTVAAIEVKKQDNTFGIVTPKRAYYVKASTPAESRDWIEALNQVKAQISHRNSLTGDLNELSMTPSQPASGQADSSSTPRPVPRERSRSTSQAAAEKAASAAASATSPSGPPVSINIPGKGLYVAPAQPRSIGRSVTSGGGSAAGSDAFSPLTTTTDSDTGAEHYGLSYASSTGISLGSSPGRDANLPQHWSGSEMSEGGSTNIRSANSPQRRGSQAKGLSYRSRDISVGSSGAEGGQGEGIGGFPSGGAAILSSSEEEDEETDEQLDRAMPLPLLSSTHQGGPADTSHGVATPTQAQSPQLSQQATSQSQSQSSHGDALLRDPNRVIIQGYLMKQSNRRKQWRKRWFVLTASKLMYSRSHMDARAHRQIPLTSILDAIEYTAKKTTTPGSPGPFSSPLTGGGGGFSFNALGGNGDRGDTGQSAADGGEGTISPSSKPDRRQSVVAAVASNLNSLTVGGGASVGGGSGSGAGGSSSNTGAPGSGAGGSSGGPGMGDVGKKRTENSFKIITPKRTFLLCAPSEEEEIKWLSALHALLTRTRGGSTSTTSSSGVTKGPAAAAAASGSSVTSPPVTINTAGPNLTGTGFNVAASTPKGQAASSSPIVPSVPTASHAPSSGIPDAGS